MLECNQYVVTRRCGLWVDIPAAVPLFRFGKRQFKRIAVIWVGERDDGFMLPAIAFIVRFS